jgi:predicted deacetylase
MRIWAYLTFLAALASVASLASVAASGVVFGVAVGMTGCSSSAKDSAKGHIVVALTIDWEGAYFSPEGLDALDEFRSALGPAPLTHFVSAAYFTKQRQDPKAVASITQAVRKGDELAVHLHAWRSLAQAGGIEPKLSPSFLTGTDKLLEFEDGDIGFDTDLDAYSVPDLRVLLRTSRHLLEVTHLPISNTFRAGGYLGTPKVLQAIREEGFTVDCSATDYRQLDERKDEVLPKRIQAIWPRVETTSQPWLVDAAGGALLEMPIAAFADYATTDEIVAVFDAARTRLQTSPGRDVFIVLGFHQETAGEFSGRLRKALDTVRARRDIADNLVFTTVEAAATQARRVASPAP